MAQVVCGVPLAHPVTTALSLTGKQTQALQTHSPNVTALEIRVLCRCCERRAESSAVPVEVPHGRRKAAVGRPWEVPVSLS